MRITPSTRIGRLLEEHPEVEEVMAWYGIDLEEYRPNLSLESLCRYTRLDLEDVISDLTAAIEEDDDPDWDEDEDEDDEEASGEFEDEDEDYDDWDGDRPDYDDDDDLDEDVDEDDEEFGDDEGGDDDDMLD
jgi:hypothetical protein